MKINKPNETILLNTRIQKLSNLGFTYHKRILLIQTTKISYYSKCPGGQQPLNTLPQGKPKVSIPLTLIESISEVEAKDVPRFPKLNPMKCFKLKFSGSLQKLGNGEDYVKRGKIVTWYWKCKSTEERNDIMMAMRKAKLEYVQRQILERKGDQKSGRYSTESNNFWGSVVDCDDMELIQSLGDLNTETTSPDILDCKRLSDYYSKSKMLEKIGELEEMSPLCKENGKLLEENTNWMFGTPI